MFFGTSASLRPVFGRPKHGNLRCLRRVRSCPPVARHHPQRTPTARFSHGNPPPPPPEPRGRPNQPPHKLRPVQKTDPRFRRPGASRGSAHLRGLRGPGRPEGPGPLGDPGDPEGPRDPEGDAERPGGPSALDALEAPDTPEALSASWRRMAPAFTGCLVRAFRTTWFRISDRAVRPGRHSHKARRPNTTEIPFFTCAPHFPLGSQTETLAPRTHSTAAAPERDEARGRAVPKKRALPRPGRTPLP